MIITAGGHSTIEWWFTCPPRASTMVWSRRKTLTTYLSTWAPSQWGHWSKLCFCKYIHLCMGMCHQKLQTGLDIHEGLTAQKYFDEMVRPHVKPHVDNHALAGSTVFIRIGAKPHTARISQDVLASATNLLLSAKNPDIWIIANLWSIMSRNIIGMNPLP